MPLLARLTLSQRLHRRSRLAYSLVLDCVAAVPVRNAALAVAVPENRPAAIQRRFLALLKRRGAPLSITKQRRIFADVESVARDVFASDSTITAVCIWPKSDKQTPFIWLSRYDHGDLVHEITHAVASIIDNRNLEGPGNSEVRAYLTEHLVRKFTKYVTPKAK